MFFKSMFNNNKKTKQNKTAVKQLIVATVIPLVQSGSEELPVVHNSDASDREQCLILLCTKIVPLLIH